MVAIKKHFIFPGFLRQEGGCNNTDDEAVQRVSINHAVLDGLVARWLRHILHNSNVYGSTPGQETSVAYHSPLFLPSLLSLHCLWNKGKKSLSFCLSVNKTWNWLHSQSPHESQPLILSHSIWEEAQKWLVWITFQMQYSCFKLNYCLSDVEHMVSLQFWSGILGNSPYIVITCKCLGTWWKGQQQWTHNGKAWAGTQSHSE